MTVFTVNRMDFFRSRLRLRPCHRHRRDATPATNVDHEYCLVGHCALFQCVCLVGYFRIGRGMTKNATLGGHPLAMRIQEE
jgi:hypothetical protein